MSFQFELHFSKINGQFLWLSRFRWYIIFVMDRSALCEITDAYTVNPKRRKPTEGRKYGF